MSVQQIVFVGGGGHCRSCIEVAESAGHAVVGYVAPEEDHATDRLGYVWLGDDAWLASEQAHAPEYRYVVAVGQTGSAAVRQSLFSTLQQASLPLISLRASSAILSRHAHLGAGCVVMHGAVINAGVKVGDNCIVNSMALLEHDVQIGHHCHMSTGSRLNGGVVIGDGVCIGSGAILLPGVQIADGVIIGAGSLVTRSISQAHTVWYGQPARLHR
jgi:sugar O-acyltransferase (sialic acid O-acetyltransferase NeuD family)